MTTLILTRHGRTAFNARRIIQGPWIDPPLDRVGLDQARRLADRLRLDPPREILTSPLRRAVETAEPLAREEDLPVYEDARLQELDWGTWNGARKDRHVLHRLEDLSRAWAEGDADARPPGGESAAEALARASAAVKDALRRAKDGTVLVVAHGRVNKILLSALLHGDLRHQEQFPVANATVTRLEPDGARWRLQELDCRKHLQPATPRLLPGMDALAFARRPAGTQTP